MCKVKTSPKPCKFCRGAGKVVVIATNLDGPLKDYRLVAGIGFDFSRCLQCGGRGSLVHETIGNYKVPKNVDKSF